ncbi:DUF2286 domain-containing protein [Sulfolobus acidocaldarius]|uniref:Conserved Crenarchaeal protein n=4 Tax=Sulfolobus acidocaldarius TaxID=2285 RepID=Q4J8M9_SULAC|nr:DUF2286 domain-containing protein [Sulfolobus acidocaldarius]AAY80852.1 conserved Crenarchaeal protein [Sulfolobus acidocaldarius DSM 639]AGE71452.1 hypothetical protein SacN8_07460 [Sulfolobus acidocaldarius N8]AGE73725.1 hypothetical protein SacRon12I_07470 [Sulfolobus acidocaldarius Ron12/I]ALU30312.1 hypothetical protein ATY89_10410 [Sulfolobus acidocaldarius]ALU31030.1 hypothetical protein ATZ20_01965 [Sulfolobus acidocaldarius]
MKILVLRSEEGNISKKEVVDGGLRNILVKIANDALGEWDERSSDFTIIKDTQEVKIPLPLKPQLYEIIKDFLKSRTKTEAIAEIPVYIISFDNQWVESDYRDKKVYIVSPYIDENAEKELEDYAKQVTSLERPEPTEPEEDMDDEEE